MIRFIFVCTRLRRYIILSEEHAEFLLGRYRSLGRRFKPCVLSAYIVTSLNGWCTKSRFGHTDEGCIFCSSKDSGDIRHLVICPQFQNVVLGCLRQNHLYITLENTFGLQSAGRDLGPVGLNFIGIYVYLAFRSFNAVRHGDTLNRRLIMYFCKRLSFHCKHSRSILRKYRYCQIDFFADLVV